MKLRIEWEGVREMYDLTEDERRELYSVLVYDDIEWVFDDSTELPVLIDVCKTHTN